MKKTKRSYTSAKRRYKGGWDDRPGITPGPNPTPIPNSPPPPPSTLPALAPETNKVWWSSFIPSWLKKKTEPSTGGRTKRRRRTRRGNTK